MSLPSYIVGIVAAVIVLIVVIEQLRRRRLRERHAIWWLIAGVLALVAAVFPQTVTWLSGVLGIALPVNLVFFVSIAILFLVNLQVSAELTRLEDRTRMLAERVALQQVEIDRISARLDAPPDERRP